MTIFLTLLLIGLIIFSLRFTWWLPPKRGLVALMYHNIDTPPNPKDPAFYVEPQTFAKQIDFMLKRGFTPINFDDLTAPTPMPKKPILITLDDGYLNNYTKAYPILKQKNVKANIFLTCDKIGQDPKYITWPQVLEMQNSGLVAFGSHTLSHPRLRNLPTKEAEKEIALSKTKLQEKLAKTITAFCYPYGSGAFDKRIRPLVFKAGYLFDFSTKKGISKWPWNNKKTIYRAFPRGGEGMFDFYLQITRGKSRL